MVPSLISLAEPQFHYEHRGLLYHNRCLQGDADLIATVCLFLGRTETQDL
jgi:hypothetical protein